mmetsp:Transcript_28460/g.62636  ORF Transcript_28460/g.62636 Transcript_28460/m.62636 type:complete len:173 (+) Transcript_28460:636-1154(+)
MFIPLDASGSPASSAAVSPVAPSVVSPSGSAPGTPGLKVMLSYFSHLPGLDDTDPEAESSGELLQALATAYGTAFETLVETLSSTPKSDPAAAAAAAGKVGELPRQSSEKVGDMRVSGAAPWAFHESSGARRSSDGSGTEAVGPVAAAPVGRTSPVVSGGGGLGIKLDPSVV